MKKLQEINIGANVEFLKSKRVALSLLFALMGFVVQGSKDNVIAQTTNPDENCVTPIGNNTINLRSGAGTNFSIEDLLTPSEILKLKSEGLNGWKIVENQDGEEVFVSGDLVKEDNCDDLIEAKLLSDPNLVYARHRIIGDLHIFGESNLFTDEQLYEMTKVIEEHTSQLRNEYPEYSFDSYPKAVAFLTRDEINAISPTLNPNSFLGKSNIVSFNGMFLSPVDYSGDRMAIAMYMTNQFFAQEAEIIIHELGHSRGNQNHDGPMNATRIGEIGKIAYAAVQVPEKCNQLDIIEERDLCVDLSTAMSYQNIVEQ